MPQSNVIIAHSRVVISFIIREVAIRYGKHPGGYLWALFEPVGYIVIMTLLSAAIARTPALGTSFPLFYATGIIAFNFYRSVETYTQGAVKTNRSALSFPGVAPIDPLMARFVLQIATTALVAIIVLTAIELADPHLGRIDWHSLLLSISGSGLIALGVALINTIMFHRIPIYEKLWSIVTRPLFLISGVLFVPDSFGNPYREFLLYNPLCHATMLFRKAFYPEYRGYLIDLDYFFWFGAFTFFVGLCLITLNKEYLRKA